VFESPFERDVAFAVVHSESAAEIKLHPEEEALLSPRSVEKRRREFRMGRAAAHRALDLLGIEERFAILRGAAGEPLWPAGVVGSITHAGDYAIAAAAPGGAASGIGIDLERIPEALQHDLSGHIASPEEAAWIKQEPLGVVSRTIVLFSAKEALFKALYPICGRYIGFKEVSLSALPHAMAFKAALKFDADPEFRRGGGLTVGYRTQPGYVLAFVALPPA
jgi:enterobactin synthetase component D